VWESAKVLEISEFVWMKWNKKVLTTKLKAESPHQNFEKLFEVLQKFVQNNGFL